MAELVDASDSKSDSARSAGSIPARGTKLLSFLNSRLAWASPTYVGQSLVTATRPSLPPKFRRLFGDGRAARFNARIAPSLRQPAHWPLWRTSAHSAWRLSSLSRSPDTPRAAARLRAWRSRPAAQRPGPGLTLRHPHKSNSRYCPSSSVVPPSSPSARSGGSKIQTLGKENPSQRKENPSSFLPRIEPFQRVAPAQGRFAFFGRFPAN